MSDAHAVARDQLRSFIERIERLEEEKKTIADDIKDVYGEAKGTGFDAKVLRKLIAIRKQDRDERAEQEAILDTYMVALGMMAAPECDEGDEAPRPSPVERRPVMALRSDAGLNILTKHEDIQGSDSGISSADRPTPAGSVFEGISASHFEKATVATQGEATAPTSDERVSLPVDDRSDAAANAGGDNVDGNALRVPTSNTGEGIAPEALPDNPQRSRLRPYCRKPGESCGGHGTTHCHPCLKARQEEAA